MNPCPLQAFRLFYFAYPTALAVVRVDSTKVFPSVNTMSRFLPLLLARSGPSFHRMSREFILKREPVSLDKSRHT